MGDAAIADIVTAVDVIAAEFALGMREVVSTALDGQIMTFGAIECLSWQGDGCVSIVGEGPIICAGMEAEACAIEGLIVTPVLEQNGTRPREVHFPRGADPGGAPPKERAKTEL